MIEELKENRLRSQRLCWGRKKVTRGEVSYGTIKGAGEKVEVYTPFSCRLQVGIMWK